eukprot:tig00000144_g9174.t1
MACGGCFPCLPNGFTVDSPPVRSRLAEIYEPNVADARYGGLILKFQEEFGKRPTYFVRAPGRVNLIGEHVDYSGYSVLPCAISQDVVMACSVEPDERLVLTNVDDAYPTKQIELTEDIVIDSKAHHWTNYFLCGYKGILEHVKEGPKPAVFGMRVAVDGTVPAGSGLSSSSAMVCASALAALHGAKKQLDKSKIATIAAKSEQYMGVMSGGMDQAISMTARAGFAKHIHFDPLTTEDVKLPAGCSIVVANTLVEANKNPPPPPTRPASNIEPETKMLNPARARPSAPFPDTPRPASFLTGRSEHRTAPFPDRPSAPSVEPPLSDGRRPARRYATADTCYNRRVVECILAAKLLASKLGLDWRSASELQASCVAGQPNARFEFPAGKVLHLHARSAPAPTPPL